MVAKPCKIHVDLNRLRGQIHPGMIHVSHRAPWLFELTNFGLSENNSPKQPNLHDVHSATPPVRLMGIRPMSKHEELLVQSGIQEPPCTPHRKSSLN